MLAGQGLARRTSNEGGGQPIWPGSPSIAAAPREGRGLRLVRRLGKGHGRTKLANREFGKQARGIAQTALIPGRAIEEC